MTESLKKMTDKINEFWSGLGKKQKIKLAVLFLIVLLSVILLVYFINRPTYVLLFNGLSPADAGKVTQALDNEYKVPYKLENDGTSIYVPEEDKDKLRIELASTDLLDDGFSINDAFTGSMSTTDMERNKKYYYFLQNEIASAIKTIDGIKDATVLITTAEDTPMVLNVDEKPATAAVKVDLTSGSQLSQNQVNGIVQFVSKSVSGLKPENVTVMDSNGELLLPADSAIGGADTQMKLKREVEETLKRNLEIMLDKIYGSGNVIVSVSAPLNFDYYKSDKTSYDPNSNEMGDIINEKSAIRSYQKLEQNTAGTQNGGAAGTNTNVTPTYPTVNNNNSSSSGNTNTTINYELNEIKEEFVKAQGQIDTDAITVSVAINSAKLSNSDLNNIKGLVKNAVGLTGDIEQITVVGQEFADLHQDKQPVSKNSTPFYLIMALIAAITVGGVILLRRHFIKRKEAESESIVEPVIGAVVEPVPTPDRPNVPIEDIKVKENENEPKKQIERLIKQKPEMVAQLVRTWLNED